MAKRSKSELLERIESSITRLLTSPQQNFRNHSSAFETAIRHLFSCHRYVREESQLGKEVLHLVDGPLRTTGKIARYFSDSYKDESTRFLPEVASIYVEVGFLTGCLRVTNKCDLAKLKELQSGLAEKISNERWGKVELDEVLGSPSWIVNGHPVTVSCFGSSSLQQRWWFFDFIGEDLRSVRSNISFDCLSVYWAFPNNK